MTVFLFLMHMCSHTHTYTESFYMFFWAVQWYKAGFVFLLPKCCISGANELKEKLITPKLSFPLDHKYEAADSDCTLSPNILYISVFCAIECLVLTELHAVSW